MHEARVVHNARNVKHEASVVAHKARVVALEARFVVHETHNIQGKAQRSMRSAKAQRTRHTVHEDKNTRRMAGW